MGMDGWMDGWMNGLCVNNETLFSLGSSSLANQSGQLGLVLLLSIILFCATLKNGH
jgi:hypothetical protein